MTLPRWVTVHRDGDAAIVARWSPAGVFVSSGELARFRRKLASSWTSPETYGEPPAFVRAMRGAEPADTGIPDDGASSAELWHGIGRRVLPDWYLIVRHRLANARTWDHYQSIYGREG